MRVIPEGTQMFQLLRPAGCTTRRSWKVSRAIEYVETHLAEPLRTYHLAKIAGLSEAHFVRSFKAATGVTSHRFVMNRRLNRAVELLSAPDESLADIAITCGFSDQSHFCRIFRRALGVSPGTWRSSCMSPEVARSALVPCDSRRTARISG
jgi:AraC family transcriptional regulator